MIVGQVGSSELNRLNAPSSGKAILMSLQLGSLSSLVFNNGIADNNLCVCVRVHAPSKSIVV